MWSIELWSVLYNTHTHTHTHTHTTHTHTHTQISRSMSLREEIENVISDSKNLAEFVTRLFMKEHSFLGISQSALEMTSKLRWVLFQRLRSSIDEIESRYICKICFTDQAVWCATPCGHVVSCINCHTAGQSGNNRNYLTKCAQCRTAIRKWVRLYN